MAPSSGSVRPDACHHQDDKGSCTAVVEYNVMWKDLKLADAHGLSLVVDNTFTPMMISPALPGQRVRTAGHASCRGARPRDHPITLPRPHDFAAGCAARAAASSATTSGPACCLSPADALPSGPPAWLVRARLGRACTSPRCARRV